MNNGPKRIMQSVGDIQKRITNAVLRVVIILIILVVESEIISSNWLTLASRLFERTNVGIGAAGLQGGVTRCSGDRINRSLISGEALRSSDTIRLSEDNISPVFFAPACVICPTPIPISVASFAECDNRLTC